MVWKPKTERGQLFEMLLRDGIGEGLKRIHWSSAVDVIRDSSKNCFNKTVGWKLYYMKLKHKGDPILAMAEYFVMD